MRRVSELHVRTDWGVVRFVYLPMIAAGLTVSKWLPALALLTLRINPCLCCMLVARWGHHVEEFYNATPLLRITDYGLRHEDGGTAVEYGWDAIVGVVMYRRNYTPMWKTDGSTGITPPYWLEIAVRETSGRKVVDSDGYINRESFSSNARTVAEPESGEGVATICFWPRQVDGGLFSLMRFARTLQAELKQQVRAGAIDDRLPKKLVQRPA